MRDEPCGACDAEDRLGRSGRKTGARGQRAEGEVRRWRWPVVAGSRSQDGLDDVQALWIGGAGKQGEQRVGAGVAVSIHARPEARHASFRA